LIIFEKDMDKKNLLTRVSSALVLGPLSLYLVYIGKIYFLTFIIVVSLFSINEFHKFLKAKNTHIFQIDYIAVPVIIYLFYIGEIELISIFAIVFSLIYLLIELKRLPKSPIRSSSGFLLSLVYLGLFLGTAVGIREMYHQVFNVEYVQGAYFLFMILVGIWSCDSFAYFGGSLFGKHKLYPKVSPKKSIEGALFGFIGTVISVYLFQKYLLPEIPTTVTILIMLLVGIFGQIGDLIESLFKRDAGIKDSGSTIPGHGGVLDRLDSFVFVTPIIFLLIYFYKFSW
jgi:phosphatidate cytidylyltransferase